VRLNSVNARCYSCKFMGFLFPGKAYQREVYIGHIHSSPAALREYKRPKNKLL
jgi:hypothetical protein